MTFTKSIFVALICAVGGCRTTQRDSMPQFRALPLENQHARSRPFSSTPSSDVASESTPKPEVQRVAFNEPDEFVVQEPEAVGTPSPAGTELAVPGILSLEQLEEIAMSNNPTLVEARARVDAARGAWLQAGLAPNTVLGYSGQQLGSHGQAEQNGVFIGQQFVRGGKLQLGRAVANEEIAIAERQFESQTRRVLTDVRLGYYEVLVAQRRFMFAEQMVQLSKEASKTADALFRAKEVSQADVVRTLVEQQSNQLALKVSRNQLDGAWSRLVTVLGTPDLPREQLAGELDYPSLELSLSSSLDQLLNDSPELHAALFEIERSRFAVARARAEGIPDIDVQGIVQWDNATGSNNGALQVSMPIPWRNYNQGGVREAEARLVAASHAAARLELNLQRRLGTVFQRYASARDQVQDYSMAGGILENANKTLQLVREGYQAGEFDYLDMLTAQRTFAQTNLAYVDAIGELWEATIEIEGLLLKDSLDNSSPAQ